MFYVHKNRLILKIIKFITFITFSDHFQDQIQIPGSAGFIFNFNQEADDQVENINWVDEMVPVVIA